MGLGVSGLIFVSAVLSCSSVWTRNGSCRGDIVTKRETCFACLRVFYLFYSSATSAVSPSSVSSPSAEAEAGVASSSFFFSPPKSGSQLGFSNPKSFKNLNCNVVFDEELLVVTNAGLLLRMLDGVNALV